MKLNEREFQVFVKPVGASCNLRCSYCYYIDRKGVPGTSGFRIMPDDILEKYIIRHFEASTGPDLFFSWHGGEPLMAGIDFFKKAVGLQRRHNHKGFNVRNGIQTNGTLVTDEWCRFFYDEEFYIGLSIDGDRLLHDKFRITPGGKSSFEMVMDGYRRLMAQGIIPEILCVVNSENVRFPLDVYRFFKSLGVRYITFIPLVDKEEILSRGGDNGYSVGPEAFGKFLCTIFDEWVSEDIGKIKIQIIEEALRTAFNQEHTLCIFKKVCGGVPVVEMNGDFYCCDHFVDNSHYIGNIGDRSLSGMLDSEKQTSFGEAKWETLPLCCRECEVLAMCNGECPKNRFILTPDGEQGLNWLCEGYKMFFRHMAPFAAAVSAEWRKNR